MTFLRQPQVATPRTAGFFLALVFWLYFSAPEVTACLMFDSLHTSSLESGAFVGMDLVSTTNHNQLQPQLEVFV